MRKGLIVGGMALLLVLGCNNGGELEAQKRLGEIGRSAENVFYSFVDLIADTLGFRVTAKTTKKQVGEYFSKLGGKVGEASEKLEEVAKKAVTDIALRAMAKGGKFANGSADTAASKKKIEGVVVSAVVKALDTLTIAIRRTIDAGLKEVKEAMKINPETTPVISEAGVTTK